MLTDFHKYHGTANDFILIDNRKEDFPQNQKLIQHLCDRREGIGADGLILLTYIDDFDFDMIYFNSDGKPGSMCGNGGRCTVAFAHNLRIINTKAIFNAVDGQHEANILGNEENSIIVKLKMSDVHLVRKDDNAWVIDTGSPHHINFVSGLEKINVFEKGKSIRYNETYSAEGINVNFVEEREDHLFVRTYERGVEDETLSCGTGVIASALAYALKEKKTNCVNIQTRGGKLKVMFNRSDSSFTDIWLEGPATFVYKGQIEI